MSISVLYCWLYIQFIQFDLSTTYGFWKQKTRNSNEMPVYIQTFYSLCILASLDLWIWFFCVVQGHIPGFAFRTGNSSETCISIHITVLGVILCMWRTNTFINFLGHARLEWCCEMGYGMLALENREKKKKRDYLGQGNGWKTRILLTK